VTGWVTSSFSRKTLLCRVVCLFVCLLFSQPISESVQQSVSQGTRWEISHTFVNCVSYLSSCFTVFFPIASYSVSTFMSFLFTMNYVFVIMAS
jgi:hypothetical protein